LFYKNASFSQTCFAHLSAYEAFLLSYSKELQNDDEWYLFYRDSTLGCRVIQDFDLSKLDEL